MERKEKIRLDDPIRRVNHMMMEKGKSDLWFKFLFAWLVPDGVEVFMGKREALATAC